LFTSLWHGNKIKTRVAFLIDRGYYEANQQRKEMKFDQQMRFPFDGPQKVDLDGRWDDKTDVRYIGMATLQGDGKYRCLADVSGLLCVVVVNLSFTELK